MKEDLNINIGTKYNGDGMKKANAAITSTANRAKSASKALGGIQSALGGVGGKAGEAMGKVGGLVQSFMQMGVAGGIIAAGTLAIEGMFKWLNKTNDALKELAKGFSDRLKGALSKVNAEIAKTNKAFQDMLGGQKTKQERENINDDFNIAKMEEQKKQALVGKDGVEAAKIELEWTKKIEDAKEAQSKKHLKDVQDEIALTEANLKKQEEAQRKAAAKFKSLNTMALEAFNNDNLDAVTKNKWADDARIAKQEMNAFDKPIADLKKKLEELATTKLKAEKDAELAPERKKTAIMQAEGKVQGEEKKITDKAAAEKAKADKLLADKAKKEASDKTNDEVKALREKQKDIIREANEQQRNLAVVEGQLADKLKDAKSKVAAIEADWADNLGAGNFGKWKREQNEAKKQERQQANNKKNAEGQQAQLAGKIFDKKGNVRRGANLFDIGRFSDITDYLGGEISPEQERGLRKQQEKLAKGLFDKDGNLKRGKENSREYGAYKQIKGLLDKKDAQYEADLKQAELIAIQTQQRELEFQSKQRLDDIAGLIEKILEKGGI